MKTHFTIGFVFIFIFTNAQNISFADLNFKNALLGINNSISVGTGWNGTLPTDSIILDSNGDNEISESEAQLVTYLDIFATNITSLSGLEHFTNLRWLSIGQGFITSFNFPSLINLEQLGINNNLITTFNLNGLVSLKRLYCRNNRIYNLNFSNCPNIEFVYCPNNRLSTLDFTNNPLFNDLSCENNRLTSLIIKNGTTQLFGPATAFNECWAGNPNLNYICADPAEISALQSFLAGCSITQPITIDSSCLLNVPESIRSKISIFPNPSSGVFNIDLTNITEDYTSLEVMDLLGKVIYNTSLQSNTTNAVNLSILPAGCYIAKIYNQNKSVQVKLIKK